MTCPRHEGGRATPQDGPCPDCRHEEMKALKIIGKYHQQTSPAFKAWTPASWDNHQSPDRMNPERKRLPHGKEENHRASR